jgi:hypothetical protein
MSGNPEHDAYSRAGSEDIARLVGDAIFYATGQ